MDNHPNVNALLDTLEAALSEDASDGGIQTGFREVPPEGQSSYVFLNRQEFDFGHMLDEDGNPIRKPAKCISGRLEDIEHFTRVSDYGESHKLRLRMEAGGQTILIETGFFTNTAKSLLSDLEAVENPDSILTIEPTLPDERRSGNSQNVLFTDLYEGESAVISEGYPNGGDQEVVQAFKNVRQNVFGLPAQEEDQPRPRQGGDGQPTQQQPNRRRQGGGAPRQSGGDGQPARQQQGGQQRQQQPNQAPPSRNATAQTLDTPPPPTA
ncbi:hypothetical protein [Salinibacter ruber]|jgi:hypothetical protein|uniref:hypothetical protein n=1 Tax=Salinibacter ruber TaxID=146919 RepID=UPI00216791A1|nr:hypothetical protein [Salinibacter ruber]MCS4054076.1 hypothetical protein [Salinibacter ruber]